MSYNIELPQFTGTGTAQLEYLHRYLFQAVQQINWALNSLESGTSAKAALQIKDRYGNNLSKTNENNKATFEEIKDLILSSAEIVDAYYESISKRLKGTFVAESDFGKYITEAGSQLFVSAESAKAQFDKLEHIDEWWQQTSGCIVAGALPDGKFGVQIGQTKTTGEGDEETSTFEAYLVLTPSRISFKDNNGIDVAYITQNTLKITNADILQTLRLGNYVLDTQNGLAFRWVEGGNS